MRGRSVGRASKTIICRMLLVAGVPLLAFYTVLLSPYFQVPTKTIPAVPIAEHVVHDTKPTLTIRSPERLAIASLGINTTVQPVGLTSDGNMAIDDNIDKVAWYQLGPKPGEEGSAVIAGHYGWRNGVGAIFNDLHTLRAGDKVAVYDANNDVKTFVVRLIRSYDPNADTTEVFKSDDGKAHLNLITCEGVWQSSLKTYSERLVVFTDQES